MTWAASIPLLRPLLEKMPEDQAYGLGLDLKSPIVRCIRHLPMANHLSCSPVARKIAHPMNHQRQCVVLVIDLVTTLSSHQGPES